MATALAREIFYLLVNETSHFFGSMGGDGVCSLYGTVCPPCLLCSYPNSTATWHQALVKQPGTMH